MTRGDIERVIRWALQEQRRWVIFAWRGRWVVQERSSPDPLVRVEVATEDAAKRWLWDRVCSVVEERVNGPQ